MSDIEVQQNIVMTDGFIQENSITTVDWLKSGLFKINIFNGEVSLLNTMKREDGSVFFPRNIFEQDNYIFITSCYDTEIAVVHDKIVNYYKPAFGCHRRISADAIVWNNKIWLIPQMVEDDLCYFDLKTFKFGCIDGWLERVKQLSPHSTSIYVMNSEKHMVYLLMRDTNIVLVYDFENDDIKKIIIPRCEKLFSGSCFKNELYMINKGDSQVYKYLIDKDILSVISLKTDEKLDYLFSRLIYLHDSFFLVPNESKEIVRIQGDSITYISIPNEVNRINASSMFYTMKWFHDKYYFFPWGANMLLEMDGDTDEITSYELLISKVDINSLMLSKVLRQGTLKEKDSCNLINLIKTILP